MTIDINKVLNLSESALFDFVMQHSAGAHLKNADNCRYIVSNEANAQIFGLDNPNDLVGSTAQDLDKKFMRKFWGDKYAKNIAALDRQVIALGKTVISDNEIFLNRFNQVRIQNLAKFPIKGKNNKVTAILTITDDLTGNVELFYLWDLYKKLHKNTKDAIDNFTLYLSGDGFFTASCEEEIMDILTLIRTHSSRYG